jgi:acetyl-CoA synthetase
MVEPRRLDAYHFYERDWDSYEQLREEFEWDVPDQFNMATYLCDRWRDRKRRVALFSDGESTPARTMTYWELDNEASKLASYLASQGVSKGDTVIVHGAQKPETLVSFVATWKLGAVLVPVSTLLGSDALRYRFDDCEPSAAVIDASGIDAFRALSGAEPWPETVVTVDLPASEPDAVPFSDALAGASRSFDTVPTVADDPASIIYTSGTTGQPKGAILPHRVALGHLPQFVTSNCNMDREPGDVVWTPVEWTWIASVYVRVVTSLFFGIPLVAYERDKFDAETAFEIIERYGVTMLGAPATALRLMTEVEAPERFDLDSVRVLTSGGESLGPEVVEWAESVFGDVAVHEGYGQTEANATIGDCSALYEPKLGTMGRAIPGHDVRIVDPETAEPVDEPGEVGEIALRRDGNPVQFSEYLGKPDRTAEKRRNGFHLTEDLGAMDEEGYIAFEGRRDDVIISAGYRIGPDEIENTLAEHPSVVNAGVVGVPDETRGTIPKAYIVPAAAATPSDDLRAELQSFVRDRLAKYEYPRELAFVDELPTTTTGKVKRSTIREWHDETES